MRMRGVTSPGGRGSSEPHIWNQRPQFAYSLYNFYGATTTIKGSLHASTPIVKRFSVKIGPKMAVFRELRGANIKFLSTSPEEAHPCAEPRRLIIITCENPFRRLCCRLLEEPGKKKPSKHFDAQFRAYVKKKPLE